MEYTSIAAQQQELLTEHKERGRWNKLKTCKIILGYWQNSVVLILSEQTDNMFYDKGDCILHMFRDKNSWENSV
jgi:hypothetical protein